jgi:hypothetical protein
LPQVDPEAVVIRLRVAEPIDLALTHRPHRKAAWELARCHGSCDIAIRRGRYLLEVGDGPNSRSGSIYLDVKRSGTYELKPAAQDTLASGVVLGALGPGVMGIGIGLMAATTGDQEDGDGLFWGGAGIFSLGAMATAGGYHLFSNRPRLGFAAKKVPRGAAVEAWPREIPAERDSAYDEERGVPPGYRVRSEPRRGPLLAGMIVFGSSYGIMAAVGAATSQESSSNDRYTALMIPVVGPMLVPVRDQDDRGSLILFGAGPQMAGVAMMLLGALSERETLVPDSTVAVTPFVSPHAAGMAVGGTL